jgi:hypothetical protein
MAVTTNKYKVKKFVSGNFDYDTLFIDVNKVEYQIPVCKGKDINNKLVGKEIIINDFDKVLEKIEF